MPSVSDWHTACHVPDLMKMDVFNILAYLVFFGNAYSIEWKVLLWLHSNENKSPLSVWNNSTSSYNNNVTETVSTLVKENVPGYRNTDIDNIKDEPPKQIRLSYRNINGEILHGIKFNVSSLYSNQPMSTDTLRPMGTQWFNGTYTLRFPNSQFDVSRSYSMLRINVDFAVSKLVNFGVGYRSAILIFPNETVTYIIGASGKPTYLPATPMESSECYLRRDIIEFKVDTVIIPNQTHTLCSSHCRQKDCPQGAVFEEWCGCLSNKVSDQVYIKPNMCTIHCQGNNNEMCGGGGEWTSLYDSAHVNLVNTDVDVSQFNGLLEVKRTVNVTGNGPISFHSKIHISGFNVTCYEQYINIRMELKYWNDRCSETPLNITTYKKSFSLEQNQTHQLNIEPIAARCVDISLYDNSTGVPLTFPVQMSIVGVKEGHFITAPIMAIEAGYVNSNSDSEDETASHSDTGTTSTAGSAQSAQRSEPTTTQSAPSAESATTQSAPSTEPATTQSAPSTEPATTQSAPSTESATTQSAQSTEPTTTQSAPSTESATTQSAPSTEPATTQSAPSTESATTQSAQSTEPATTQSAPSIEPATTQSAQSTEPATTQSAQSTEQTTTQSAPSTESATTQSAPSTEPATTQSAPSTESATTQSAQSTESATTQSAQSTESATTQSAQSTEPTTTQSAQSTESASTQSAQSTESATTQSAQSTESATTQSAQSTESATTQSAQSTEPTTTQSAQSTEPTTTQFAQSTESATTQSAQSTESATTQSAPRTESATTQSAPSIESATTQSAQRSEPTTTQNTSLPLPMGECMCSCSIYNILYGKSPFDNMTYEEIKTALKDTIEKRQEEMSVDKTKLSSTIRKKTSAPDKRVSSSVVGYSLGVALLATIFGAMVIADLPRLYKDFQTLTSNLKSRFGNDPEDAA